MKVPRGFILVNIDKRTSAELRALAECDQLRYQGVTRHAIEQAVRDLETELGISAKQALAMSKRQRARFRRRHSMYIGDKIRVHMAGHDGLMIGPDLHWAFRLIPHLPEMPAFRQRLSKKASL